MNINNNRNYQLSRAATILEIEEYAEELCAKFNNFKFKEWYCKVIHTLGIPRTRELVGRAEGAPFAGRLFSKLANEEITRVIAAKKIEDIKNN